MKPTNIHRIISFILLFVLTNSTLLAQNVEDVRLTERFREQPMREFLEILQQKYHVKVFYKESWIAPYTITKTFVDVPLIQALKDVFGESELSYTLFQDNTVVVFRRAMDARSNLRRIFAIAHYWRPHQHWAV